MPDAPNKSPWIVDARPETFQQEVVERSRELPVVIDFWATWCQPCRMLGPILEKLADEYQGRFLLVKAETEKLPDIAAAFGVQSIPAVYALRHGELLDYFVGLLSEAQIREWLNRLLPTPAEELLSEAAKLEATDAGAAEARYREAARLAPNLAAAKIGLAGLLLKQNRVDEAAAVVEELESRGFLEPEAERLKSQVDLRVQGSEVGNLDACRAAAAAQPEDLDLKFKLAEALASAGQYEEALQLALSLVQADRKRFGERARKIMVDIFHLLPGDSELASRYRRQLSTALY
jgi:putative thioredoxin